MMTVLHAFNEPEGDGRDKHIKYWYGSVRAEDEMSEESSNVVCWCGGRIYKMSPTVAVVWHGDYWPDSELDDGF